MKEWHRVKQKLITIKVYVCEAFLSAFRYEIVDEAVGIRPYLTDQMSVLLVL